MSRGRLPRLASSLDGHRDKGNHHLDLHHESRAATDGFDSHYYGAGRKCGYQRSFKSFTTDRKSPYFPESGRLCVVGRTVEVKPSRVSREESPEFRGTVPVSTGTTYRNPWDYGTSDVDRRTNFSTKDPGLSNRFWS